MQTSLCSLILIFVFVQIWDITVVSPIIYRSSSLEIQFYYQPDNDLHIGLLAVAIGGKMQISIQGCLYKYLVFWLLGCRPQCTMGEIGGSGGHLTNIFCFSICPIYADIRLSLSFPIITGKNISLTDVMWRAWICKPVTFEPFELQKWQSTKNGTTLHQKPIYTISAVSYAWKSDSRHLELLTNSLQWLKTITICQK